MSRRITRCTVKTGANAGAAYFVRTRKDWGQTRYTVDAKQTGWHKSAKDARLYAEGNGYIYVTNRRGERTMVHESAAQYYAAA